MGQKLLAFDVGNSRLKVAIFDGEEMVLRESLQFVADWQALAQELKARFSQADRPDRCLIAS
ncbi:MAG: type III pantothenate kinase, partial [Candidatus Latescibacteria bacterium]|nr:type III pantothenate kinase [Candidatus Latescibacterota bacterium]